MGGLGGLGVVALVALALAIVAERGRRRARASALRATERLRILAAASRDFLLATEDLDGLIAGITRRVSDVIGGGCSMRLVDRTGEWLEPPLGLYHPDPSVADELRKVTTERVRASEPGLASKVLSSGDSLLIPVVPKARAMDDIPERTRVVVRELAIASLLLVPVKARGKVLGLLGLVRYELGKPFTIEDQLLAEDLADRAGLALLHAELLGDLERRVAERTQALESSNRELETFSYTVSHDLRAPLRAIDGFNGILLEDHGDKLDAEARALIDRVSGAARRMGALVDDLLAFARLGRTELESAPVALDALAEQVIAELRHREPSRQVEVAITPGLEVRGDRRFLLVALENLLGNAWKFSAGRAVAHITIGRDGDGFVVRDDGAGFEGAGSERLFTPFTRFHAAGEFEGSGIGLATVARVIQRHGGRVWAESKVGEGTTIHFTVPGAG